jgi:hypothetical protein
VLSPPPPSITAGWSVRSMVAQHLTLFVAEIAGKVVGTVLAG